ADGSPPGRADGATVAAVFAVVLLVVPARPGLKYLPLSLTPANVVSLGAALLWLCAQLTLALGAAKGRNPVRTALFAYFTAMLATYGFATAGPMESDELNLADHSFVLVVAIVGLALTVCDGVRGLRRLDFVLKALVVAGAVIAVVGALQFLVSVDLTRFMELPILRYTNEGDPYVMHRAGPRLLRAATGSMVDVVVSWAMLWPFGGHYGVRVRALGEPSLRWWLCALVFGCGLMFSVSRSALLSLGLV